jgi:hypothetical protein
MAGKTESKGTPTLYEPDNPQIGESGRIEPGARDGAKGARGEARRGRPETLGGVKARAFCRVPRRWRLRLCVGGEEEPGKGKIGRRRLSKNLAR